MRYHIKHEVEDRYDAPVQLAKHLLHLRPRECQWQQVERFAFDVKPQPVVLREGHDGFGNPVVRFEVEPPYSELRMTSEIVCDLAARPWATRSTELAWEHVRDFLAFARQKPAPLPIEAQQYQFESPYVRFKTELGGYAGDSFLPGRPLLDASIDLMHRINADINYKAGDTNPSVVSVLERRRGGSQDIAHLMIGCLRSLGLAARYVAGYLHPDALAGAHRRVGTETTHAWVAVYTPDLGWVEFDPVLDSVADQRHVVLGWGRDFGDVSPLRAVIHGGGEHTARMAVTITPLDTARAGEKTR